ncbi:MAG: Coenzyme F420 hydrogenase/dehydrogenase, beta subunit C-terminal domain [Methanothrix sp.]|nr:Coenzyme F420 hydrogenase/dehydrogenase, beta subunit C-terminal domain [Methanothrix sp.]
MAAKEKFAEPTYLECGFGELEHKVIKPDICCRCGTCEAFCPRIDHVENKPALVNYDPLCGLCFTYCPRTFLDMGAMESKLFGRTRRDDEALGIFRKAVSAQAQPLQKGAQDGGVTTALLVQALNSGLIDCAIVTDRDHEWRTVTRVATSAEEIRAAAGTKYTINNSVMAVKEALDKGFKKIGFVGTPCQIQGLRKVKLLDEPYQFGQDRIVLLVGLFCMENFDYDALMKGLVKGKFGLDPKNVARFEIKKGMFRVIDKAGEVHEVKIEETDPYTFPGCGPCFDFASELADVSVGSVGSGDGWSTVLTRTDVGEQLYNAALAAGNVSEKAVSEKGLALAKRLGASKVQRFVTKSEEMKVCGIIR